MNPVPLCWICRSRPATTREHRLKQTDARDLLGAISQSNPGYFNDKDRKNAWVRSTNSDLLKHKVSLCEDCNSRLTQPYDMAWETVATALRDRPAKGGTIVRASRLVPYDTHRVLLGAHLFLAKKLGSSLVDAGRYDDTVNLSAALLAGRACPYLYLTFFPPAKMGKQLVGGETDIDVFTDRSTGELRRVHATYSVVGVTVFILYAMDGELVHYGGQLWHPRQHTGRMEVRRI